MTKISFNDINPNTGPKPTSIRDVHLSGNKRAERREKRAERRMPDYPPDGSSIPQSRVAKRGSFILWVSAIVIVAALVVISTFLFIGRTNINLTVRVAHVELSPNVVHTAYRSPGDGELGFITIKEVAEASKEVAATETKFVEKKASGKLTVYNDYSTKSQRIIKNTRFESPDGKIYRVHNSFVVPGHTKGTDGTTPGTLEITVYADKAGEEYNKDSAKFTIPGLKNDPRFDKFWAETSGAITGGFSGKRPTIAESDLASTRESLRTSLKADLKEKLLAKLTPSQNLFDDAIFITFSSDEKVGEDGKVEVIERAEATAVVFNANALASELAKDSNTVLHEGDKLLSNPSDINFKIVQKEKINPTEDELIQFTTTGSAKFLWDINTDSLKEDLAGKESSVLDSTLSNYPGVKDAYVTIRPFWRNNFPTDTDDITVKVETEQ